jgi:hypothetical protein
VIPQKVSPTLSGWIIKTFMSVKSHISSSLSETEVILGSSNCNFTSPFGVIVQMWLALSLDCDKYTNTCLPIFINELVYDKNVILCLSPETTSRKQQ